MGKISIIIPVYNTEEYITECMNSLQKQTYQNIEIILINDDSNHECTLLLENLAKQDERVHLYHFKKNKGVGAARNFGIDKAKGKYIYFLDSDDYLPPKTLELLVTNIGESNLIRGRMRSTNLSNSFAIIFEGLFKTRSFVMQKYNLIKNNSAVNFLFRKKFIINKNLRFSEDVKAYSNLAFMIPALISVYEVPYLREAIYFKRKRNDPISNPSLSQCDNDVKFKDFLYIYNQLKDKYLEDIVNDFLDNQFLNLYRKNMVTHFKNPEEIDTFYQELSRAVKRINISKISRYDIILKKEIRALASGNIRRYKRINARHHLLRDIRQGLKTKRKFLILLYRRIFMRLPMKENLIFMESFLGKSYSDSPKYIYEYMIKNDMNFKYVWSVDEKKDIPVNSIQVKRFSLRYFYYLGRAKYWVSNSRLPRYLDKRDGNIYLQTWHGTPLKTLVFDQQDIFSADPNYKSNFYNQSRRWDYLSSPNEYSSNIFKRAFKYDKKMLEFGYPRNDILYQKDTEKDILSLKQKMNLPNDKKVVLYAPTWRDDEFYSRGKYKFTLQLDLKRLQEKLGNEYVVILRMHYFIASQMDISDYEGFVYDFSNYNDIAELYLISDILITDYSSVFFDFANLKRPILFFTYDLEKYRDTLRGFYLDIENEVPGPLLKTSDEVIQAIEDIASIQDDYQARYDVFYQKFCKWDDGNAAEKTVKTVFDK